MGYRGTNGEEGHRTYILQNKYGSSSSSSCNFLAKKLQEWHDKYITRGDQNKRCETELDIATLVQRPNERKNRDLFAVVALFNLAAIKFCWFGAIYLDLQYID